MKDHIEVRSEETVECEIEIQFVATGEIVTLRNDKYVTALSVDDGVVNPFIWSEGNYQRGDLLRDMIVEGTCKDCKWRSHGSCYEWDTCTLLSNTVDKTLYVKKNSDLVVIEVSHRVGEEDAVYGNQIGEYDKPFGIAFRTHESFSCIHYEVG